MKLAKQIYIMLLVVVVILASAFGFPDKARAAPTFVQKVEYDFASSGDALQITGVTAGSLIIYGFSNRGSDFMSSFTGVTDDVGGALTKIDQNLGNESGGLYFLANAAAGTHNLTATYGGGAFQLRAVIAEYSGVATASPLDGSASNKQQTGTSATTGTTAALTETGELVVSFACFNFNRSNITATAPATLRTAATTKPYALGDDVVAATTAVSRSFGVDSTIFSGFIATFKASSSGTAVVTPRLAIMAPLSVNGKVIIN